MPNGAQDEYLVAEVDESEAAGIGFPLDDLEHFWGPIMKWMGMCGPIVGRVHPVIEVEELEKLEVLVLYVPSEAEDDDSRTSGYVSEIVEWFKYRLNARGRNVEVRLVISEA
jgi:hypothetical protein